jgi:hypothetical protein
VVEIEIAEGCTFPLPLGVVGGANKFTQIVGAFPMKRSLLVVTAAVALMASSTAHAAPYDFEESDHPLRLVSYPVFFVGKVAETLIARPITYVASQPKLRNWFGRTSNPRTDDYVGTSEDYQRRR